VSSKLAASSYVLVEQFGKTLADFHIQGAMATAYISERFGRKTTLLVAAFFFFVGSLLQTVCATGGQSHKSALDMLYVGRAIGGFGVGIVSVTVPTVSCSGIIIPATKSDL
jgi:MFS family permease